MLWTTQDPIKIRIGTSRSFNKFCWWPTAFNFSDGEIIWVWLETAEITQMRREKILIDNMLQRYWKTVSVTVRGMTFVMD